MPIAGVAGTLWHANLKINARSRGFQFKYHLCDMSEADARTKATDIAQRFRKLMPTDSNIFFATIGKDGRPKDSRFLPDAVGDGEYAPGGPPPVPAKMDYSKTAVLVRFEHADGGSVTRKINPIPDGIITAGDIVPAIVDVVGVPAAPAAPGAADWETEFENLMKAFVLNTHHVYSNHAPGGAYQYTTWVNAYVLRVGDKKGGRDFIA